MIGWLRQLFCQHEIVPVVTTYAPPVLGWSRGLRSQDAKRAALHGMTTVLARCDKCGKTQVHKMLGAASEDLPPERHELAPGSGAPCARPTSIRRSSGSS